MLPTNAHIQYIGKDKNNAGIYELRIYLGYKNGKERRKSHRIHASSKRAAIKKAEILLQNLAISADNIEKEALDITFSQFVEIWKNRHLIHLSLRTQRIYQDMINSYLTDMFGPRKIKSITASDIRYFLQFLHSVPNRRTRGTFLSPTMIHKYYRLLSQLLSKAQSWKYITQNPCKDLEKEEIPKPDYHHAPIWEKEDLTKFIRFLDTLPQTYHNVQKITMFYMILMTGLRSGEIAVLQWSDINFTNKTVSVTKSLKLNSVSGIKIGPPKTKSSVREIPFDDFIGSLLQSLQQRQQDFLQKIGKTNPDNYIFVTQRLKSREIIPVTESYLYIWLRHKAKDCNLPAIDVHSLRHMAATYALASGAPILGVQNMMGHTNLKTTSIYLHLMTEQKQQTANVLSAKLATLRTNAKE